MYEEAQPSIQINDHVPGPIPTHSSVREGCPRKMLRFALCVEPLLCILAQKLPGIQTGKRARKTVFVALADDITNFLTTPTDIPLLSDATKFYKKNHGSSPDHLEIEGNGGGRIQYIHGYVEHNITR